MFLFKRGNIYYLAFEDHDGKRKARSTGATCKSEAIRFLLRFDAEKVKGEQSVPRASLEQFTEYFLAHSASVNTEKTVAANKTAFAEFARFVGGTVMLSRISVAECERFLAKKTVDASAWTARKYYLALGAAFEKARRWGYITENPWKKVTRPRVPQLTPLYFTREQFKALLAVINDRNLRELVTVAALTGLRRGELLAMQWSWIDLTRRVITVKNESHFTTKNKRVRVVPLCDEVVTLLLSRKERANGQEGFVFHWQGQPLSQDRVSRRLKVAIDKADLPEQLHFHSLRHTFASWLVQGGVSLFQVGRLLGHSNTQVTEIYAHLAPSDMHSVLGPLHLNN